MNNKVLKKEKKALKKDLDAAKGAVDATKKFYNTIGNAVQDVHSVKNNGVVNFAGIMGEMEKHLKNVATVIKQATDLQQQLRGKDADIGRLTQEVNAIKADCARIANEKDTIIASLQQRITEIEISFMTTKDEFTKTKAERDDFHSQLDASGCTLEGFTPE